MKIGDKVAFSSEKKPTWLIDKLINGEARLKILIGGRKDSYAKGTYSEKDIKRFGYIISTSIANWREEMK